MLIKVHYNKFQAPKGLPWTVHTSKGCLFASHVSFRVPVETEESPRGEPTLVTSWSVVAALDGRELRS